MTKEEKKEYMKLYREKNKEKIAEQKEIWRENNKEKELEYGRKSYNQNIEKRREYDKNRYNSRKNQSQLWREDNKELISIKRKERYIKNKEKEKSNNTKYYRERRNSDPLFKLRTNIRTRIKDIFRKKGYATKQTTKILGCTFEQFKIYIENQFEPWMTWDNCGLYNGELNYGWDIDHIKPVSLGNCEESVIALNHYTNLQPLCSKVNRDIKKNNVP